MTRSFKELVRDDLKQGLKLTVLSAFKRHKSLSLRSRISDLKHEGMSIKKEMIKLKSGKYIAQYSL